MTAENDARAIVIAAEFADRLDMLEDSDQLSRSARELTVDVLASLSARLDVQMTEDNAAQFVTHLAVALTRLARGDDAAPYSAVAEDEVRERPRELDAVRAVMADVSRTIDRDVPDSEVNYLAAHVCAVVDEP